MVSCADIGEAGAVRNGKVLRSSCTLPHHMFSNLMGRCSRLAIFQIAWRSSTGSFGNKVNLGRLGHDEGGGEAKFSEVDILVV
jgi:hypothetical protein